MRSLVRIFVLLLILALMWRLFVVLGSREMAADLAVYEVAARRIYTGQDIYLHPYNSDVADLVYNGNPPEKVWFDLHYLYPPFFAAAIKPLLSPDHLETKKNFNILNLALMLFSGVLIARVLKDSIVSHFHFLTRLSAVLAVIFVMDSFYINIAEGQVNILILALILSFLNLWELRCNLSAGYVLAIAALIKITPVLLLAGPVRSFQRRLFFGFILLCLAAVCALCLSPVPYAGYQNFFSQFWNLTGGALEEGILNLSLQKLLLTTAGVRESSVSRILFKGVIVGIFGLLVLKMNPAVKNYSYYATSILVIGMLLSSPITWSHHLVLLLVPFATLLLRGNSVSSSNFYQRMSLQAGFLLVFSRVYLIQNYLLLEFKPWLVLYYTFLNCALIALAFILFRDSQSESRQC